MKVEIEVLELEFLLGAEDSEVDLRYILVNARRQDFSNLRLAGSE